MHRVRKFSDTDLETHKRSSYPYEEITITSTTSSSRLTTSAIRTITHLIREYCVVDATSLFSKLATLHANGGEDGLLPAYLPYIGGDRLRKLSLNFGNVMLPEEAEGTHSTILELLPSMGRRWSHLSSIDIDIPEYLDPDETNTFAEGLTRWVKNLPHLQSLRAFVGCYPSLMQALSELPLLHAIDLTGQPYLALDPTLNFLPSVGLRFRALQKLKLINYLPDSPVPLLRVLDGSQFLTKITLAFDRYNVRGPPTVAQAAVVFEAISHLPAVRSLDVCFRNDEPDAKHLSTAPPLNARLWTKLFRLKHLRHLKLTGFLQIHITDQMLGDAAHAWPELEDVQLLLATFRGAPLDFNHASLPSLIGVQALCDGCPRLTMADLPVNDVMPSHVPVTQLHSNTGTTSSKLTLSLRFRPVDRYFKNGNEACVAMFISLLFPQLKHLTTYPDFFFDGNVDEDDYMWEMEVRKKWKRYRHTELEEVRMRLTQMLLEAQRK